MREKDFKTYCETHLKQIVVERYIKSCIKIEQLLHEDLDVSVSPANLSQTRTLIEDFKKNKVINRNDSQAFNKYVKFYNSIVNAHSRTKKNIYKIANTLKGEEQQPFTTPNQGYDRPCNLVQYNENVPENQRVEGLCQNLEAEYLELIYNFAEKVFGDFFENHFPTPICIKLQKECPSIIYLNSDEYVSQKINSLIKQGKMVTPEEIAKILRFNMRMTGEFIKGDAPYIKIYFNQFDTENMEEYVSMIVNVLAHEFAHYLEYEYCKQHKKRHYQDARLSEAIADFFSVLFSLYRNKGTKYPFDLQVAENRYRTWRERENSGWPYAHALFFLPRPHKNELSDYNDEEIENATDKLREVFQDTLDAYNAYKTLTK